MTPVCDEKCWDNGMCTGRCELRPIRRAAREAGISTRAAQARDVWLEDKLHCGVEVTDWASEPEHGTDCHSRTQ